MAVDSCLWRHSAPQSPPIPPGSKAAGAALRSIRGTAGRRTAERIILYVFLAALRAGDREKFIMPFFTGLLSLSAWLGWVGELGKLRVDPVICNLAQHKPHQDCPTRPGSLLVSASRSLSEVQPKYLVLKSMFSCCMTIGWERNLLSFLKGASNNLVNNIRLFQADSSYLSVG